MSKVELNFRPASQVEESLLALMSKVEPSFRPASQEEEGLQDNKLLQTLIYYQLLTCSVHMYVE